MKHKDKISFLKALSVLVRKTDIENELLSKLEEKMQSKNDNEKEKIILDLIGGLKSNEEFLVKIIKLKNVNTDKMIQRLNEHIQELNTKITANNVSASETFNVNKEHVFLLKILVKNKLLSESLSKNYITSFINILMNLNNRQLIYSYWSNSTHQNFKNSIQKLIFSDKNIVDLFFLHILNLYLLLDEGNFNSYIGKVQNNLKITIASYIKIIQKTSEVKNLLTPLSIIAIFTNLYSQSIQINNFGQVQINEIFTMTSQNDLKNSFSEYLDILHELNILYNFLEKMENIQNQLENDYIVKILKIILEKNSYYEKILIDFCILFSKKIPDEYEKIINQKNEENEEWYKDFVLDNLSNDNGVLHNETLKFLQLVKNWQEKIDIKKKVKEFIKKYNKILLSNDHLFSIAKVLVERREKFDIGYGNELGEELFSNFKSIDQENSSLEFVFNKLEFFLRKEAIDTLINAIFNFINNHLNEINQYQSKLISYLKEYINIDENKIRLTFDNLITGNINNLYAWKVFSLICENTKLAKNKDYIRNELEKLKKNMQNEEVSKIISEIINKIEEHHAT